MKTLDVLLQIQTETRSGLGTLVEKVDTGFAGVNTALAAHAREDDTRFNDIKLELQPLVELRKGIVWAKRTFYGSALLAVLAEAAHIVFARAK